MLQFNRPPVIDVFATDGLIMSHVWQDYGEDPHREKKTFYSRVDFTLVVLTRATRLHLHKQ